VTALFTGLWEEKPLTFAVGDSPNDAPMLLAVDNPFVVQRPNGTWADLQIRGLEKIPAPGPSGFSQMVDQILQEIR